MLAIATRASSLFLGIGLLLVGIGLQGTSLALRASLEQYSVLVTGVIMSAYFAGFIAGTFLGPRLIRVVGHIRAFAAFAAVVAAAAISHGLVVDPWAWVVLRLVTGTCMVGLYMVVESWLNALVNNTQRGRIYALYTLITLIALALGQYLILVADIGGERLFAITALLVALAVVPVALTRLPQPAEVAVPSVGLARLYAESPLGVSGALVSGINTGAFWGVGALFGERIGLTEVGIAGFMSLTVLGGVLLQWPIGLLSDRYDRRRILVLVTFLNAAMATLVYLSLSYSVVATMVLSLAMGGFMFSLYGISAAHVNDHLADKDMLDSSRNLQLMFGIGAVMGPMIAGFCMQQAGPGSLLLFFVVVLLLLGAVGLLRLRTGPQIAAAEQMDFAPMPNTSQVALELDPRLGTEDPEE